jgi:asparagine synthase (glutamine-hydrolysing)
MCGIAGFAEFGPERTPAQARRGLVEAMAARLTHRGPDEATGLEWRGVSIAFRRLSINGIRAGSQPFHSADGRISACVNGELYNHRELRLELPERDRLRSGSDCEVLPDLCSRFGVAAFERINGMFAAVVLDRGARELLLVRDRMGIKPLFYVHRPDTGRLIFASELKALFAHPDVPRRFDWLAALTVQPWPRSGQQEFPSFFDRIERVPPGGVVRVDLETGALTTERYWDLEQAAAELAPPLRSEAPRRFRELLDRSVDYRVTADAGVGLFLSGGIDSVAIAALAAPRRRVPTFSVWNPATVASGDAAASRLAARSLGLTNHAVCIDGSNPPTPDDWRNLLWACELFSITPEQWYKFQLHAYARAMDPALKVVLIGQGADEFLGGYLQRLTGLRRTLDSGDWNLVEQALASGRCAREVVAAGVNPYYQRLFRDGSLDAAALDPGPKETWRRYRARYRVNLDYHLWHEDRTAAAHGIENRVPFLDHRLLAFVASIPESQHARWFSDKRLLRRAVADLVPPELAVRPKAFFYAGPGELDAYRLISGVLEADGGALLEQAAAGSRASDGPLTEYGLRTLAARVLADPALREFTPLMNLVNMGVLAELAARTDRADPVRPGRPPQQLDEPGMARLLATGRELDGASVLALSSSFSLLEMRRPGYGEARAGTPLLAEGNELREDIDNSALASFLERADGRASVDDIAAEAGLDVDTLWPALREAMDLGLLVRLR